MARPRWKLAPGDTILAAWAAPAAGPGWSNQPVWVVVRDGDGRLREECIQPAEQSAEMVAIYPYSARSASDMKGAVERMMARRTKATVR